MFLLCKGGRKRQELMQKARTFMSIDSDRSATVSTGGAASIAGSDIAGQLDTSVTKV